MPGGSLLAWLKVRSRDTIAETRVTSTSLLGGAGGEVIGGAICRPHDWEYCRITLL
jgi:hypothetical protein